jgi:hypothetical protein
MFTLSSLPSSASPDIGSALHSIRNEKVDMEKHPGDVRFTPDLFMHETDLMPGPGLDPGTPPDTYESQPDLRGIPGHLEPTIDATFEPRVTSGSNRQAFGSGRRLAAVYGADSDEHAIQPTDLGSVVGGAASTSGFQPSRLGSDIDGRSEMGMSYAGYGADLGAQLEDLKIK